MTDLSVKILDTDRLVLRVFESTDLDAFAEMEADPDVMHYYTSGPRTRDHAARGIQFFQEMQGTYGHSLWAVDLKGGSSCIGYCGLIRQNVGGRQEVEIGYKLAKAHWGHGYASEAATAVRDWGFENLRVRRLIAIIDPLNDNSIRVAEKVGLHYVQNAEFEDKNCRIYAVDRPLS